MIGENVLARLVPFGVRMITQHLNRRAGMALLNRLPLAQTCFDTTVTYSGVRLNISTGESIGRKIYYFGEYENTLLDAFVSLLRPGMKVFDVGANMGIYSLVAAARGAFSWAFEPSPEVAKILKSNIKLNGVSSRVFPVQEAVAEKKGEITFYAGRADNMGVGRIFKYGENSPETGSSTVQTNTLDYYANTLAKPDLVKMDIEGAELLAFRGARELLAREDAPAILIEVHPGEIECLGGTVDECIKGLVAHGYRTYTIKGCPQASHEWYCFSKTQLDGDIFKQVT